jgi:hypothetical protein
MRFQMCHLFHKTPGGWVDGAVSCCILSHFSHRSVARVMGDPPPPYSPQHDGSAHVFELMEEILALPEISEISGIPPHHSQFPPSAPGSLGRSPAPADDTPRNAQLDIDDSVRPSISPWSECLCFQMSCPRSYAPMFHLLCACILMASCVVGFAILMYVTFGMS